MKMKASEFRNKCISEKAEQQQCLQILNGLPNFNVWRVNTGAAKFNNNNGSQRMVRFSAKGMPDIQGYVKKDGSTVPFFWEVKRKTGKLSSDQKDFLDKFNADGCYAGHGTSKQLMKYLSSNKLCNWTIGGCDG